MTHVQCVNKGSLTSNIVWPVIGLPLHLSGLQSGLQRFNAHQTFHVSMPAVKEQLVGELFASNLNLGCVKGSACNVLDRLRPDSIILVLPAIVVGVSWLNFIVSRCKVDLW